MPVTVRVRGIYATALTVLLRGRGYLIVDTSKVLQERLGIPLLQAPAQVTVKSVEERPDDLLVFAYPWDAGVDVEKALLESLEYAAVRRSILGNNTVVAARITREPGGCKVELPGGRIVRSSDPQICSEEGIRLLTVVHDPPGPGDRSPILRPVLRLVGYYVILTAPGEGASFSEHIRDRDRATDLLLLAGETVDLKSVHVHFRSNSKSAPIEAVKREIEELQRELTRLAEANPGEPAVVRRGEYLSMITVPRPAKDRLDELRASVYPTIRFHHSLKSFGDMESAFVDCSEHASKVEERPAAGGASIMSFLAQRSRRITITHMRPDGTTIRLGPFRPASVVAEPGRVRLELERTFTRSGILDALGVEKRPGDRSRTRVDTDSWTVLHEYISQDGRLLGVYANINTPPEIGDQRIKYLDLYVDVAKRPGEPAWIVDEDELEEARKRGLVTEALYRRALEEAERARRRLDSQYP